MPKLTNLIKESNLIVINGDIGAGKSLLLTKLANHPEFLGKIFYGQFSANELPKEGNIFIDDDLQRASAIDKDFWTNARRNKQKIFTSAYQEEVKIVADLVIQTRGVSKDKKRLICQVRKENTIWNKKIKLTTQDFAILDAHSYKCKQKHWELDNNVAINQCKLLSIKPLLKWEGIQYYTLKIAKEEREFELHAEENEMKVLKSQFQ